LRIALHSHYEPEQYRLPHQGLWFVLMLMSLLLLWSKSVAATQCVIAYSRMLMPMA